MSRFTPGAAACMGGLAPANALALACRPMKTLPLPVWLLLLVPMLALALGLQFVAARAIKQVLARFAPLARGERRVAGYERAVHDSTEPSMQAVVLLALAGGVALWCGAWLASVAAWWLAAAALLAATALDVALLQRVEIGDEHVWFQRGLSGTVHQMLIDNIRDTSIDQGERCGFTLPHGRDNRSVRLKLRTKDRRVVALPKTGTHGGIAAIEEAAARIDERLAELREVEARRRTPDHDLKRALRRLKRNAHAAQPA